jgi:hypothetical protein
VWNPEKGGKLLHVGGRWKDDIKMDNQEILKWIIRK